MLPAFYIRNYRLFKELEIPNLKRVNLIIGKNNVGKSTLLEALTTYINRADFLFFIFQSLANRKDWQLGDFSRIAVANSLPLIFHRRVYDFNKKEKGIFLGEEVGRGMFFYIGTDHIPKAQVFTAKDGTAIHIGQSFPPSMILEENQHRVLTIDYSELEKYYMTPLSVKGRMIQAAADVTDISFLWEKVALTEREDYVVQALQIIDSSIERIAFVDNRSNSKKKAIVQLKGRGKYFPVNLGSMGDGLNQLLKIVLALVNCENGACLIDEIETGLHWSVQPDLWRMIFFLAEKLNIQVFATTHSRDCLWALQKTALSENHANDTQVIKLKASPNTDNIKAITMDIHQLSTAIQGDIEIR